MFLRTCKVLRGLIKDRSNCPEVFCKKGVRNFVKFTGKRPCQSLFFNKDAGLRPATLLCSPQACYFIKGETLAQVFSCEFCEISKNTFSYRTPPVTASENLLKLELFKYKTLVGILFLWHIHHENRPIPSAFNVRRK